MPAKYNTKEGISAFLEQGLQGFHDLMQERKQAFERREKLQQFVLLGRWWLLDNSWPQLCVFGYTYIPDSMLSQTPAVMTMEEFSKFIEPYKKPGADEFIFGHSTTDSPPPVGMKCGICNQEWTLANSYDISEVDDFENHKLDKYVGQPLNQAVSEFIKNLDQQPGRKSTFSGIRSGRFIDMSDLNGNPKNEDGWLYEDFFPYTKDDFKKALELPINLGDEINIRVLRYFHVDCQKKFAEQRAAQAYRQLLETYNIPVKSIQNRDEVSTVIYTDRCVFELFELRMMDCYGEYLLATNRQESPKLYEQMENAVAAFTQTKNEAALLKVIHNKDYREVTFSELGPILQEIYQSFA